MTDGLRRGRAQFLLLAALFFGPLLAAIALYTMFPDWRPQGRTNHGELINPARPVPAVDLLDAGGRDAGERALRGKWSFVYLGAESGCDDACGEKLYQIRQVRTLLNDKRLRVRRVYIAPDAAALVAARAALEQLHPDLEFFVDSADHAYRRFFDEGDAQALYLVDPLGNWLMWYPASTEYKGMLKDIKTLLSISQIG